MFIHKFINIVNPTGNYLFLKGNILTNSLKTRRIANCLLLLLNTYLSLYFQLLKSYDLVQAVLYYCNCYSIKIKQIYVYMAV